MQYPGFYHILYILIANDFVFHNEIDFSIHNWLLMFIVRRFNKKKLIWEPAFRMHYYCVFVLHLTILWKNEVKTKKSISIFFVVISNAIMLFFGLNSWTPYISSIAIGAPTDRFRVVSDRQQSVIWSGSVAALQHVDWWSEVSRSSAGLINRCLGAIRILIGRKRITGTPNHPKPMQSVTSYQIAQIAIDRLLVKWCMEMSLCDTDVLLCHTEMVIQSSEQLGTIA